MWFRGGKTFEVSNRMSYRNLSLIVVLCFSPLALFAKVKLSNTSPVQIPINEYEQKITSGDVQKIIPLDLRPSKDVEYVAGKVGDRAFQTFMKTPAMQDSSVGRTAQKVESSMKAEMNLPGTGGDDGEKSVDHKIGFSILALQAIARMTYTGWVNAELNLDARENATIFQISEKVWNNKQMTLSHTSTSYQGLSALGLRWSF